MTREEFASKLQDVAGHLYAIEAGALELQWGVLAEEIAAVRKWVVRVGRRVEQHPPP